MIVVIAWRNRVGPFVSGWTVPIATVIILAACVIGFRTQNRTSLVNLIGLSLDILGAFTLAGGLWTSRATRIRVQQATLAEGISHMTRWQRVVSSLPLAAARKCGSGDDSEASPTAVQELVDVSWGMGMLCLGFVGQVVSTLLQMRPK
jgi:hypothetical protein